LTPLCVRKDLEEHDHDDTGPECPTERVEQVATNLSGSVVTDDLSAYPPTYAAMPKTKPIPRIQ
jgi:hypothetical protein